MKKEVVGEMAAANGPRQGKCGGRVSK